MNSIFLLGRDMTRFAELSRSQANPITNKIWALKKWLRSTPHMRFLTMISRMRLLQLKVQEGGTSTQLLCMFRAYQKFRISTLETYRLTSQTDCLSDKGIWWGIPSLGNLCRKMTIKTHTAWWTQLWSHHAPLDSLCCLRLRLMSPQGGLRTRVCIKDSITQLLIT
jgi:hypothetical protein